MGRGMNALLFLYGLLSPPRPPHTIAGAFCVVVSRQCPAPLFTSSDHSSPVPYTDFLTRSPLAFIHLEARAELPLTCQAPGFTVRDKCRLPPAIINRKSQGFAVHETVVTEGCTIRLSTTQTVHMVHVRSVGDTLTRLTLEKLSHRQEHFSCLSCLPLPGPPPNWCTELKVCYR
ncbi:hypothetical protein Pcinc_031149 [Petrolisthes cinctipes]|uniref:Uncharacterized protein n=1 Tax=Petrolisthes cinctipes TaxID=88211 RepID=A0AAE1K1J5_PETCI|nr:hypothetical protein Pcinc_031149 [Petrolisthes cinctipes]